MKNIFFKRSGIVVMLVLFVLNAKSQSPIAQAPARIAVALDKMNVLYIGVDNPITIASSGTRPENIVATISPEFGQLINRGGGRYITRMNKITDECYITVTVKGKIISRSVFRVRTVPEPSAFVPGTGMDGNPSSAVNFRTQGGVSAGVRNFPFDLQYEVVSFTFTCDTDEGDIVSIPVNGALFQGMVRNAINRYVRRGALVTIENIRVKCPDGRILTVPSLVYYIW